MRSSTNLRSWLYGRALCCSDTLEECVVDEVRHQVVVIIIPVGLTVLTHQLSDDDIFGGASRGPLNMNNSSSLVLLFVVEKNMLILVVEQVLVRSVLCVDLVVFPVLPEVVETDNTSNTRSLDLTMA